MRRSLIVLWCFLVLWYEIGTFFLNSSCSWPTTEYSRAQKHVLIIADPQILDSNSYPGRLPILTALSQFIVDLNLSKGWRAVRRLRPDIVIFLGDMMDGGRADISDNEYAAYHNRFRRIFDYGDNIPSEKVHYVPGNHDVGLGSAMKISSHARERFEVHFGALNRVVPVNNYYNLVLIDSPGLVDEENELRDYGLTLNEVPNADGAIHFIKHASATEDSVILFSHIPLYRPPGTDCGPMRERGTIRAGGGPGYQNILGTALSQFVLEKLDPILIFSGDDHDYCEYVHPSNKAREVTVKSMSIAMGIRKPGYHLLSIPDAEHGLASPAERLCLLPDQLGIYLNIYLPCFVVTVLILLIRPLERKSSNGHMIIPIQKEEERWRRSGWIWSRPLRRREKELLREFCRDLVDVAMVPLGLYVVLTIIFVI